MPMAALPADPCTISMHTRRIFLFAAAAPNTVRAGTMASSNGSARVAPMPLSMVRRGRCLFVMYIDGVSLCCSFHRETASAVRVFDSGFTILNAALFTTPRMNEDM